MPLPDVQAYRDAQLALIPLRRWNDQDREGRPVGKAPRDPLWRSRQYTHADLDQAVAEGFNVGYRMGPLEAVIDYDPRHDPTGDGLRALVASLPPGFLETCPEANTPSGGHHWYVRLASAKALRANVQGMPGVELKTKGRQVVAVGSRHPNGGHYEWNDFSPPLTATPELPEASGLLAAAVRPGEGDRSEMAGGELSPDQLARLLAKIDPEDFQEHDAWLSVGMAAYHATGGQGVDEFVAWSTADPDYEEHGAAIRERWPTFGRADGPVVTIRTLFHYIEDAGGTLEGVYGEAFPDDLPPPEPPPPPPRRPVGAQGWGDQGPIPPGPLRPIQTLNQRYCLSPYGGKVVILVNRGDADPPVDHMSVESFKHLLANQSMEVGDRQMPIADAWMRHPLRRTAEGIVCDPSNTVGPTYVNTWQGWAVTPKPHPWPLIAELMEILFAGGVDYVKRWCAFMIQHPELAAEVAIVLRGARGTGKGTFFSGVLGAIAGRHGRQINSGLTRQFNGFMRETIYLFADEAFWAGDKSGEGRLKGLITEKSLSVESKGYDPVWVQNRLHIAIASNEDWVVPAGPLERRFAVFEAGEQRQGDVRFWNAIRQEMADGGVAGFMHDMLALDISGWHPRLDVPQSPALVSQRLESMDTVEDWWLSILRDGMIGAADPAADGTPVDWETAGITVSADHLQDSLKNAHARGRPMKNLAEVLGRRLRMFCPGLDRHRIGGRGARVWHYTFPALPICRAAFERHMGGEINW